MISEKREGTNYTALSIGQFNTLQDYVYDPVRIPGKFAGKLFLKKTLQLTGMEISFNSLAPGKGMPFYHKHRNHEELFICIRGKGELQLDGDVISVHEGSCVRIAPEASRCWKNTCDEAFIFVVVQAKNESIICSEGEDGYLDLPTTK